MPIRNIVPLSVRRFDSGGDTRVYMIPPALRGARAITLLIHGYNNSLKVAETAYKRFLRTSRLAESGTAGQVCAFYWPGDHGWWNYHREIPRAKECASILQQYLTDIASGGELRVSLVCHSLGNRLALELIENCRRDSPGIHFERAAMMAAAVPLHFVDPDGRLHEAAKAVQRREVLYSHSDEALGIAFIGGQLRALEPCYGAVGKTGGPSGVWTVDTDFTPYGHGDYWREPESALTVQTIFGGSSVRYLPRRSRLQRWLTPLSRMPHREMPSRLLFTALADE